MSSILDEIRGRREVTIAQMLSALDLYPGADLDGKRQLLTIASRGLRDERVVARWIKIAAVEPDDDLKAALVARIAALDVRSAADVNARIDLLVSALAIEAVRGTAVRALARAARGNAAIAEALVTAYRAQHHRAMQRLILATLLQPEQPTAAVRDFLLEVIGACDADLKLPIVDRLLLADALPTAQLARLLDRSEPEAVRLRVLDHVVERSLVLDDAVCDVIERDPSAECRVAALRAIAARGLASERTASAVLDALRNDPDAQVRQVAASAFEQAVELSAAALDALVAILAREKATDLAQHIIGILTPHVSRMPAVAAALAQLLTRDIDADIAVLVCRTLGRLVTTDGQWLERFIAGFAATRHDRVRAAILEALAQVADPDARLVNLYLQALEAPEPKLRAWGVRGLVNVPMDEPRCATLARGARALLDRAVDPDLRLALARKLAVIPDKPDALVAVLAQAADHATGELRDVCRRAHDAAAAKSGAAAIDWQGWHRRVSVDHDVTGVFPEIFFHFAENPDVARRILRAALAPDALDSLYRNQISASTILEFLAGKHAIDDDLSRYLATTILTQPGNAQASIALLKMNLAFPALRASLWEILEHKPEAHPILMREMLCLAHGDEAEAARELRERLLAKPSAAQATPYVKLLALNLAWAPAAALLGELAQLPRLLDQDTRRVVDDALLKLGTPMPAVASAAQPEPPPGPGLLDE